MHILMALSQLEVTGAEVYTTTLGNALTEKGHTISYVSDTLTKSHKGKFFPLRFNKRSLLRRFWHLAYLIYLIKKEKIQLVHAHSRASSWSCHIACKLTRTPMVTSIHGRQPVHATRKKFHAMGDRALPVCEAIYEQLIEDLGVSADKLTISRNGINTEQYFRQEAPQNSRKIICIIGRLTGPKGDLCFHLLNECLDFSRYQVQIVSGSKLDPRFEPFKDKVDFLGFSKDVVSLMAKADLVIGAGRVAMEALLCGRPTFAIGEANSLGLITIDNIQKAMATNFGDIGKKELDIDFSTLSGQIEASLNMPYCNPLVTETIKANYGLTKITAQIEDIYQSVYVHTKQKEIPVLMYHRFIEDEKDKGHFAPYLDIKMFDKHLTLLKKLGFETLTFKDLNQKGVISRLEPNKRYCMITVDDGFKDNLTLMLPLLEKHQMKAIVYVVTGENFNRWDVEKQPQSEQRFDLMTADEIKTLAASPWIEIGGHTLTHPHLDRLSASAQEKEINANKAQLEALIGEPLVSFAYPYGDWNEESKKLVKKAGYAFALATNSGPLALHEDLYLIHRIGIFPRTDVLGLMRKITGSYLFRKYKKANKHG